jgi:hypothetical protein
VKAARERAGDEEVSVQYSDVTTSGVIAMLSGVVAVQ